MKKGIGHHEKENLLKTKQHQKKCVYCEDMDHNFTYYKKVKGIAERKKILMEKSYASTALVNNINIHACSTCNERHHYSICSKLYPSAPRMYSTDAVVLLVDGVKFRALLDTEAGS